MALGTPLTEAFVRVRLDDSQVDNDARTAGTKAGRYFGSEFDRNADTHGVRKTGTGMTTALPVSASTAGKESGRRFGSAFSGAVKGLLVTGAAYFGTQQVIDFLKTSTEEAREAEKVGSRTANVIKSTGGAAGVTAKQVADLAQATSEKVGQDDEAIQSGENLLLTFKNIRDETGKGNDVFSQTTGLMVDMSVAMDQDMKSSAIQLGKALNDPTKGLSALSRVGVTFTDGQEKQIKHLQKTGDLMGAQKVILHELKSEFGGAGKAMADPADRAKVAWGNLEEDVGTAIMPKLNQLANWFTDEGLPEIRHFAKKYGPDIKEFGSDIFDAGKDIAPMAKTVLPVFADALGDVAGAVGDLASTFNKLPKPLQTALITGGLFALASRRLPGGLVSRGGVAVAGGAVVGGAAVGGAAAGSGATGVAGVGAEVAGTATAFTRLTNSPLLRKAGWLGLALGTYDAAKQVDGLNVNTEGLGRNVKRIRDQLEDSAIGDYAGDIGINIDRLAKSLATQGSKGEYAQEVMRKLQVRGENLGESFFREVVNPFKMQNDKLDQARYAYQQLIPAIDKTIGRQRRDADATKDATTAGQALFDLLRSNLIPSTANLADKYDLSRREARDLRGAIADTTGTAKQHEDQLRDVAKQLGLTRDQTQNLIEKYRDIPDKITTVGWFDDVKARGKIRDFKTYADGQFRDLGDNTYAILVNGQSGHGRMFDVGGWTGPGPKHRPAGVVHADEFVTRKESRNAMESRFPGVLDYINQYGSLPGYLNGGQVGPRFPVQTDFSALRALVRETVKSLQSAGGSVPATLAWVKRQVGDPYLMGGTGPNAWDCSGFMSGITHHLLGQSPYGPRLFATSTFPTSMFARGPGLFMIGSTRDAGGGIGHMAGTLGGVNVESSGDVGVHMGGSARGARDPLFGGNIWHLKQGLIKQVIAGGRGDVGAQGGLSSAERWIIGHESGPAGVHANNPSSSAFGLGQLLSSNRVAYARRLGLNWHRELGDTGTTSYDAQLAMMRMYIGDRYGSAGAAKAFWQSHGWYGDGLSGGIFTKPTMIGVGERGPERVDVTPLGNTAAMARAFRRDHADRRHDRPVQVELDLGEGLKLRGVMRGIARDEVDAGAEFDATVGRMGRRS